MNLNINNQKNIQLAFKKTALCMAMALPIALSTSSMSYAQGRSASLEEVVVTAQKQEQDLQTTPLAVSVFSGEFMEDSRMVDFTDVGAQIPGFSFSSPIKTQTTIAIRGAGSVEDSAGADQAVGVFIDDVYMGNPSTFDFDLYDLERLEVLRGPQGTIFGKNVVGGALNIITRNPTEETVAKGDVTFGRFGRFDIRGSFSGPLVEDELFGLMSFSSRSYDGHVKNTFTGNRLDQDDQVSGRTKLLWKPSESFEALISGDYSRDKSYGISRVYVGPGEPSVGNISPDWLTVNHDLDGGYDRTMWGTTAKLSYFLEDSEIISITSYRKSDHTTATDVDGTPFAAVHFTDIDADVEQITQELRFSSSIGDLDYISGLYYYYGDYSRIETLQLQGAPGSALANIVPIDFPETLGQRIKTKSYAAFLQGTYNVSDTWRVTLGGRYTWEEKYGNTVCILPGLQCGVVYNVPVKEDWSAFTPKLTVDTDVSENVFAYATISKGFKSGGFASGFEDAASAEVPFDPEYALNYEIGFKSRWLEDRLQMNIAAYYVDYDDLQVRIFSGTQTIVGNAGSSTNQGIETEFIVLPTPNLELWLNYSYMDGEYDDLLLEGTDYSGQTAILSPEHSVALGGSYTVDLSNGSMLVFAGDFTHKTEAFTSPSNNPVTAREFKALTNASITYTLPDERWEIKLWGKNLTDEEIGYGATDFSFFASPDGVSDGYAFHYGPPRTYGLTVSFEL